MKAASKSAPVKAADSSSQIPPSASKESSEETCPDLKYASLDRPVNTKKSRRPPKQAAVATELLEEKLVAANEVKPQDKPQVPAASKRGFFSRSTNSEPTEKKAAKEVKSPPLVTSTPTPQPILKVKAVEQPTPPAKPVPTEDQTAASKSKPPPASKPTSTEDQTVTSKSKPLPSSRPTSTDDQTVTSKSKPLPSSRPTSTEDQPITTSPMAGSSMKRALPGIMMSSAPPPSSSNDSTLKRSLPVIPTTTDTNSSQSSKPVLLPDSGSKRALPIIIQPQAQQVQTVKPEPVLPQPIDSTLSIPLINLSSRKLNTQTSSSTLSSQAQSIPLLDLSKSSSKRSVLADSSEKSSSNLQAVDVKKSVAQVPESKTDLPIASAQAKPQSTISSVPKIALPGILSSDSIKLLSKDQLKSPSVAKSRLPPHPSRPAQRGMSDSGSVQRLLAAVKIQSASRRLLAKRVVSSRCSLFIAQQKAKLAEGVPIIKHPRSGAPRFISLKLSMDRNQNPPCLALSWDGKSSVAFESVQSVRIGLHTDNIKRHGNPNRPNWYMTIFAGDRTLDLELQSPWRLHQLYLAIDMMIKERQSNRLAHREVLTKFSSSQKAIQPIPVKVKEDVKQEEAKHDDERKHEDFPSGRGLVSRASQRLLIDSGLDTRISDDMMMSAELEKMRKRLKKDRITTSAIKEHATAESRNKAFFQALNLIEIQENQADRASTERDKIVQQAARLRNLRQGDVRTRWIQSMARSTGSVNVIKIKSTRNAKSGKVSAMRRRASVEPASEFASSVSQRRSSVSPNLIKK